MINDNYRRTPGQLFSSEHLVAALIDVVQGAGLQLQQLLLQQPRDLHLGLLHRQLLRALDGQVELSVTLGNTFTRPIIRPW